MLNISLSIFFLFSLVASGESVDCPEFKTEHGATWIYVEWDICGGMTPEDVLFYRIQVTDLTLNIHNSSENKFCRDPYGCFTNLTLLMPCLDYDVTITLIGSDENATVKREACIERLIHPKINRTDDIYHTFRRYHIRITIPSTLIMRLLRNLMNSKLKPKRTRV